MKKSFNNSTEKRRYSPLLYFIVVAIVCLVLLKAHKQLPQFNTMSNNIGKSQTKKVWPQVILFGDSITQYAFDPNGGWAATIADKLIRRCDVINRGFSGYNTRWNKLILPKVITSDMSEYVSAVVIFLGANDSNNNESFQSVPIEEYHQNLLDMINYLQSIGIDKKKIILITPPACDEEAWFKECDSKDPPLKHTKDNELAGKFAARCVSAAKERHVEYVDLFTAMMNEKDWKTFLSDGLHFSAKGSEFMEKLLWSKINEITKDLPIVFPLWNEIDAQNPKISFQ